MERTAVRSGPAVQAEQSCAIQRKQNARKSRRPSRTLRHPILDRRKRRRAHRHVAQRQARQARGRRLRPGTSWEHSTPENGGRWSVDGERWSVDSKQITAWLNPCPLTDDWRVAHEAAWVRASSKVEKRMCWPLISERSSCQSSLGILRKTSTTAGSNCVPEQRRISSRAESKPRALR